jgi:hypothetical protein
LGTPVADTCATGIRARTWKPVSRPPLLGYVTVETDVVTIYDCPVFQNGGVGLPSTPILDAKGRQKLTPDGKRAFQPTMEWRSSKTARQFGSAIVTALREAGIRLEGVP